MFLGNFCDKSYCSLVVQSGKNLPAMQETGVRSLGQEDPLGKGMATHSVFLSGKSHGQRSLVSYSAGGHKESDTIEQLSVHTHTKITLVTV